MIILSRRKLVLMVHALALVGICAWVPSAKAVTNPSSVKIKIFEMRLSQSANCSNSITVFSNGAGTTQDMVNNPTLGAGAIPNGSYKCVMVKISNLISYVPVAIDGACVPGTTYQRNIFRAGSTSVDPNGNVIHGQGATSSDLIEVDFWAYFAIGGTVSGQGNSCNSPSNACTLSTPITITSDRTGTLVTDFDGQIDGSSNGGTTCDLKPPSFTFR